MHHAKLSNYQTISAVINIIWFGSVPTEQHQKNLQRWHTLYSEFEKNLWIDATTISREALEAIEAIAKQYAFVIQDIEKNTDLKLYGIIRSELDKQRWWSAADATKFSILLKRSGYIFDINIRPGTDLIRQLSSDQNGILYNNTPERQYKLFAVAHPNHPFLQRVIDIIQDSFGFLAEIPEIKKAKENLYRQHCNKQHGDYHFACAVTGQALQNAFSFEKELESTYQPLNPQKLQTLFKNWHIPEATISQWQKGNRCTSCDKKALYFIFGEEALTPNFKPNPIDNAKHQQRLQVYNQGHIEDILLTHLQFLYKTLHSKLIQANSLTSHINQTIPPSSGLHFWCAENKDRSVWGITALPNNPTTGEVDPVVKSIKQELQDAGVKFGTGLVTRTNRTSYFFVIPDINSTRTGEAIQRFAQSSPAQQS
jgi:hypothetical protein